MDRRELLKAGMNVAAIGKHASLQVAIEVTR
jgi:hypothetical protein